MLIITHKTVAYETSYVLMSKAKYRSNSTKDKFWSISVGRHSLPQIFRFVCSYFCNGRKSIPLCLGLGENIQMWQIIPVIIINLLHLNSDQHQIPMCNISAYSSREVMRIKEYEVSFLDILITSPQYFYKI